MRRLLPFLFTVLPTLGLATNGCSEVWVCDESSDACRGDDGSSPSAGGEGGLATSPSGPVTGGIGGVGGDPIPEGGAGGEGPIVEETIPFVVHFFPALDERGVAPDADISLQFSEPMDMESVEGAFHLGTSSGEIGDYDFSWNDDATLLTIERAADFPRLETTNPADVAPWIEFGLLESAVDAEGDALPAFSSKFAVPRRVSQTITTTSQYSGTIGRNDCASGTGADPNGQAYHYGFWTALRVGRRGDCDASNVTGAGPRRVFLHFDLDTVPVDFTLESASLDVTLGDPFGDGWDVVQTASFRRVDYGTTPLAHMSEVLLEMVFGTSSLSSALSPTMTASGSRSYDVQALVSPILEARGTEDAPSYVQFRLAGVSSSGVGDVVLTARALRLVYTAP